MLRNRSRGGDIPLMYSGDKLAGHLAVTLSSLGKFKAISMTVGSRGHITLASRRLHSG
jgi:hypothetical protein